MTNWEKFLSEKVINRFDLFCDTHESCSSCPLKVMFNSKCWEHEDEVEKWFDKESE